MNKEEFDEVLQGYIGAQAMQYGNVEDRLRILDARVSKLLSSMNYNQTHAIVQAQREARKHLRNLQNQEKAAIERRQKAEASRAESR